MTAAATPRVRAEWLARVAAEYTSAAITQHFTLWLLQAGAPPDLLRGGLDIVLDEIEHSELSQDVYAAAGGSDPPALDRDALALHRTNAPLEHDLLRACVSVFCLGETVAVPLFSHLREPCTVEPARVALDRILRDEVRHRDFGWDVLDWLCSIDDTAPARVTAELPAMLAELDRSYGRGNPTVAEDLGEITADERAWGLAPPREYAEILARTIEKDYRPRFAARHVIHV